MLDPIKNLCETCTLPPSTRERFLPLREGPGVALSKAGVLLAGHSRIRRGYAIGRPHCRHHAVLFSLAGRAAWRCGDSRGQVSPGDVLFLPAGEYHAYIPQGPRWDMAWFHLENSPRWEGVARRGLWKQRSGGGRRLAAAMEGLLDEHAGFREDRLRSAWTILILGLLERELGPGGLPRTPEDDALDAVWRHAGQRLEEAWTVGRLASGTPWSPPHFARRCVARYGEPPLKRIARLRMERAEGLLSAGGLPVAEVARRVGYENAFAFSAAFRRHAGRSPDVWRGHRKAGADAKSASQFA